MQQRRVALLWLNDTYRPRIKRYTSIQAFGFKWLSNIEYIDLCKCLNCSTWRSLIPVLEDRPLTVCDFQCIDPNDLIAADRVYPPRVGEVYYLRHNDAQRWYWISDQTPEELILTIMYDSAAGPHARCMCLSVIWFFFNANYWFLVKIVPTFPFIIL